MRKSPFLFTQEAPIGLTLAEALKSWCGGGETPDPAVALVYTPRRCEFAILDSGSRLIRVEVCAQNRAAIVPVNVEEVFEARVFNRKAELRWLNDPTDKHRTVVVAETPVSWLKADPSPTPCVGTIRQRYVIWGQAHGPDDLPDDYPAGWTRFSTAQVGALDVPVGGLDRGARAALLAREYLRVKDAHGNDEHGNVTVFEERLRGIVLAPVLARGTRSAAGRNQNR
jgi:CRISPR-associated protein (TIGR03984 family)